jgi:hypothetical protein
MAVVYGGTEPVAPKKAKFLFTVLIFMLKS